MGRGFYIYSFNATTWLDHVGSKSSATLDELYARLDQHAQDPSRANVPSYYDDARRLAMALIAGDMPEQSRDDDENGTVSWFARILLTVDQVPECAPAAPAFAHALAQTCLSGGTIDEHRLATDSATRRVVQILGSGLGILGGRPSKYSVYAWLRGGEFTAALAKIISSPAWAAYVANGRYNPKRVPVFEKERAAMLQWVNACVASGKDIYFDSMELFDQNVRK